MSLKAKIRQHLVRRFQVPEIPVALNHLAAVGFQPIHIFDVGAYRGEFAKTCLGIWSNAKVACFEALEPRVQDLNNLAQQNPNLTVFPMLLGAQVCDLVALHQAETASSVLVEQIGNDFPAQFYPMRTVDHIVQEHFGGRRPDLLKIDVQGYELEVLKGAIATLPEIQVILAEVNLLDIHQNVPLLADLINWLNDRDWVAYDICGLTRRPLDQALWQADFIFVPRSSKLRSDKRWTGE